MKDFASSIKGVCRFAKPAVGRSSVSVALGIVRIAASLAFVWISKLLVDIATGEVDKPIVTYVWVMIGILLLQLLTGVLASYFENYNILKTQNSMRYRVFESALRSSWNGRETFHSGDITNRIQEDVRIMTDVICTRLPDIVITVCQLVASSIYLLNLAPRLLFVLVALMVVAVVCAKLFYKVMRKLTNAIRELDSRGQEHIQENLQNRIVVLTLIGIGRVLEKLGLIYKDLEHLTVKRMNYGAVARGFMSFGFMSGYAAAFLWGIFGIRDGAVTYGMMTAFLQLVGQVQRPVADLSRHIPALIHSLTSEERLSGILDLSSDVSEGSTVFSSAPGICFRNVCFEYPGQNGNVLQNFSCEFKPGVLTALVGPTGEGKSTLTKLAMGLLKPQSGEIVFYDRNGGGEVACSEVSKSNFMYVPQGNSLMSGTIRENLLLADSSATEERMREVLHTAVADFVYDLPDGLDSRCGESGSGLSEGQAQRIAIARALLHTGTVLILDESTSALDSETENRFLANLSAECIGKKTIVFISHRDRVISNAEDVISVGSVNRTLPD